jgi:glycosyltransferase involved in cell wall biosynthesis
MHNRYQIPGGEDAVVAQEVALLRANGVEVETFFVNNDGITTVAEKVLTATQVTYSWQMRTRAAQILERFKPDVMHVHNTFPLLTPSVYDAAHAAGCPVVQTIHNYRLMCLNGTLFRDGKVCTECTGKRLPWPGVQHRCYRASTAGSASVALMLVANRLRGAWSKRVARFLMLTPFARDFFVEHTDIPVEKMRVKPNAAADPGMGRGAGGYALFVGRLSPEKGISVLLEAARQGLGMPLKIAGQGPLEADVRESHFAGQVEYVGPQTPEKIRALMHDAAVLLVPSLWFEGLPMVIPEAFGAGLPVVASAVGSLSSLVDHEQTGLLVRAGDWADLAAACRRLASDSVLLRSMRGAARKQYLRSYQPAANLALLSSIYSELAPAASPLPASPSPTYSSVLPAGNSRSSLALASFPHSSKPMVGGGRSPSQGEGPPSL